MYCYLNDEVKFRLWQVDSRHHQLIWYLSRYHKRQKRESAIRFFLTANLIRFLDVETAPENTKQFVLGVIIISSLVKKRDWTSYYRKTISISILPPENFSSTNIIRIFVLHWLWLIIRRSEHLLSSLYLNSFSIGWFSCRIKSWAMPIKFTSCST